MNSKRNPARATDLKGRREAVAASLAAAQRKARQAVVGDDANRRTWWSWPVDAARRALARVDWAHVRERLTQYAKLARMHKPIGAALLLWPTWWALWLAAGDFPPWGTLIVFTLGVFLMRSAGCVINDYADRDLDPLVKRTHDRPIAAGLVTPREALVVFAVLIVLAFLLVLLTNRLTVELSLGGAFLAMTYPFMKRYTYLPQVYLGMAFGWSIPMAFAAVKGADTKAFVAALPLCGLLYLANVLWSTIYDTQYAMVDRDDDIRAGAKSTAILFGDADLPILGVLMVTFLCAMLLVAQRGHLHWAYFSGIGVAALLFGWQQWIMRGRGRDACFAAFRNNNWVGLALWVGIALSLSLN
ncbi:MAG TPA: 4-hydroxybenzoate octaprenyltransferase [Rhodanobacteraceae bacterium]|jgi:4-hydroxybenzoate polyprenyltransferase|nr:4-hydroxybenzoate octaprenyltransferase [Rhodanobacteraceae bacterium]